MRRPTKPRYPIVSGSGIAFSKRKTYSRETGSRSRYISRSQKSLSLYIYTVYPIRKIDPPISPGILYPANGSNHFSIQSELKIPELRFPGKEKVNYPELGKTCGYRSSLTARRTDGRTEIIHLRSFLWSRRTRLAPPLPRCCSGFTTGRPPDPCFLLLLSAVHVPGLSFLLSRYSRCVQK